MWVWLSIQNGSHTRNICKSLLLKLPTSAYIVSWRLIIIIFGSQIDCPWMRTFISFLTKPSFSAYYSNIRWHVLAILCLKPEIRGRTLSFTRMVKLDPPAISRRHISSVTTMLFLTVTLKWRNPETESGVLRNVSSSSTVSISQPDHILKCFIESFYSFLVFVNWQSKFRFV